MVLICFLASIPPQDDLQQNCIFQSTEQFCSHRVKLYCARTEMSLLTSTSAFWFGTRVGLWYTLPIFCVFCTPNYSQTYFSTYKPDKFQRKLPACSAWSLHKTQVAPNEGTAVDLPDSFEHDVQGHFVWGKKWTPVWNKSSNHLQHRCRGLSISFSGLLMLCFYS